MDDLIFPDGVRALTELLDGQEYAGHTLTAGTTLTADSYGQLENLPFAQLFGGQGGTTGYVDQSEMVRIDVYAAAGEALRIAQAIKSKLGHRTGVDTAEGFLDNIKGQQMPTATEHTDRIDRAVLLLTVISRPKN